MRKAPFFNIKKEYIKNSIKMLVKGFSLKKTNYFVGFLVFFSFLWLSNSSIANAAPTVSSITPNSGPASGGTNVTISGTNFIPPNTGGAAGWETVAAKTLPGNLAFSSMVVVGEYVYAIGGHNGSAYTNVIYRASVSDPTTWSDTGKTLPTNLAFSHPAVIGDYIYLFGGWTGSNGSAAIYRASVSDPTTWEIVAGKTLPLDVHGGMLRIVGSTIYIFGGYSGPAYTNTIYSASVSDPVTWSNTGSTLPVNLGYAQITQIGESLYIFGGKNAPSTYSSAIYSATTSTPTSWTNSGNLPEPLHYMQLAVVDNNMYLYGGYNGSSTSNKIYRASTVTPSSWENTGSVLPSGLYGYSIAIIGSYIYSFGGSNGVSYTNVIYRAPLTHNRANVSNPSWQTNWQTVASDQSNVTIGGTQATNISFTNSTTITATTPAHAFGTTDVVVTNYDGQSATLSNGFTFTGPPIVSSITPSSGTIAGGDSVTISGSGFNESQDSYTKLLLHSDANGAGFLDSSASNATITATGNTTQSSAQSKFGGKSAYFDGNGDYLSLADSDDWDFGSSDFTIDFWMKTSAVDAWDTVIEYTKGNTNADSSWYAGFWSDSTFFASIFDTNSVQYNARNSAVVNDGNWHHVAIIRNGGQFITAVDGQFGTPVDVTGKTVRKFTGNDLRIGLFYNAQFFNGYLDELRISKGIARWTSNFTPPAYAYQASVLIGGTPATSVFSNSTTIAATTPAHAVGAADVTVINADGQSATLTNGYTYTELAPTVSSITPTSGPAAGGTNVTISGSNFITPNTGGSASWSTVAGKTLPNIMYGAQQSAVIGDYVYIFGGHNGSIALNTIYRAPVSDPTTWSNTGATLPTASYAGNVAVIGDTVYIFGGYTTSYTNVIYSAPTSNPTAWTNTGKTLPGNLSWSHVVQVGSYLYLFGGYNGVGATNVIYRASVSDPTTWTDTGSTLPYATYGSPVVRIGNSLYMFGTWNGAAPTNAIYSASVSNPLAWSNTGSTLPSNLGFGQPMVIGEYVYLLGGFNGSSAVNSIYRASIFSPLTWVNTGQTIPVNSFGGFFAIINNYAYLFGGSNPYDGVYRAPVVNNRGNQYNSPWQTNWSVDQSNVTIGGTQATNISFTNSTTITATTPAHAFGTTDVVVTNYDGQSVTLTNGYTFTEAPSVSSITPSTGTISGGDSITITGTNFYGSPTVTFGGASATSVTVVNPTTITAVVPAHAVGQVNVVITNPDTQTATLTNGYTYTELAPTVSNITPNSGPASGGTNVTISGTNFKGIEDSYSKLLLHGDGTGAAFSDSATNKTVTANGNVTQSASQSKFGGNSAYFDGNGSYLGVQNSSDFDFGSGDFTIDWWQNASAVNDFKYVIARDNRQFTPFVVGFSGTNAMQIYLSSNGTGYDIANGKSLGSPVIGNWYHYAIVRSGNSFYAFANGVQTDTWTNSSAIAVGNADLQIGKYSGGYNFNGYVDELRISKGIARWTSNFTPPVSAYSSGGVTIGGTQAANISFVNPTTITATTPAHAAGATDVVVTNYDGQSVTLTNGYTYSNPITVSSITPDSGTIAGGDSVTISGSGFYGSPTVTFGGASATSVTVVNPTTITAVVPAHAVGQVNVVVTNPDTQAATLTNGYTYTELAPTVSSITPDSGPAAGGTNVTISGTNFITPNTSGFASWGIVPAKTLPSTIAFSKTAVIGDKIYMFGGRSGSTNLNTIYRANISDPTTWTNTGATLPASLYVHQVAVIGDYVYIFGGYTNSALNTIYRAPISDPTSWTDTGKTLPSGLYGSSLQVIGDYVYLFGGNDGANTLNTIYSASVSDPTTWTNTGATLPGNLHYSSSIVLGDYVYLFGGDSGTDNIVNVIYRAPVSNPTAWVNTGSTLPATVAYSSIVVIGDYVYLLGGWRNGSGAFNTVYSASVTNPTSWTNVSTLPNRLFASSIGVIENYLYLFGGFTEAAYVNTIYRIELTHDRPNVSNPSWVTDWTTIAQDQSNVTIGGTQATNISFTNSTTITATTPAHAAGATDVVVTNYDGQSVTLSNGYTFNAAPTVSSINPSSVNNNQAQNGIAISGTFFANGASVKFTKTGQSDINCGNAVVNNATSITCDADFTGAEPGAWDVVVTNTDGQSGSLSSALTVVGYITKSNFVTSAYTIKPSVASYAINLQLQDSGNRATNAGGSVTFDLSTTSGTGEFSLSRTSWSPVTSVSFSAGQNTKTIYYKDSTVGTYTITAAENPSEGWTDASQQIIVSENAPYIWPFDASTDYDYDDAKLNVSDSLATLSDKNAVSPIISNKISATFQYSELTSFAEFLGPNNQGSVKYQLSHDEGSTWYWWNGSSWASTVQGVTQANDAATINSNITQFHTQSSQIGIATLTFRAYFISDGNQSVELDAVSVGYQLYPYRYTFVTVPASLSEGETGTYVIQAQDQSGNSINVTADTTISLSTSTPLTGKFAIDLNEDVSTRWDHTSVTMTKDTSSVTVYYQDSSKGSKTLTGSTSGQSTIAASISQTVKSKYRLRVTGVTDPVDMGIPSSVTIQATDYNGSPVYDYTGTIQFSSDDSAAYLPANFALTSGMLGNHTFVNGVSMMTQGEMCVNVTDISDSDITGSQCSITVGPARIGSVSKFKIVTPQQYLPVDTVSNSITIQMQDSSNNPAARLADTTIYIDQSSGTGQLSLTGNGGWTSGVLSATIPANSTSINVYFKDTTIGAYTLRVGDDANLNQDLGFTNDSQLISAVAGPPNSFSFDSDVSSVGAGDVTGPLHVTLRDSLNNVVTTFNDQSVYVTAPDGGLISLDGVNNWSDKLSTTIAAGDSGFYFYYKRDDLGTETLTISDADPTDGTTGIDDDQITATIVTGSVAQFAIISAPASVIAGQVSTGVMVQARDMFGNITLAPSDLPVYLYSDSGDTQFSLNSSPFVEVTSATIATGQSSATFYFKQMSNVANITLTVSDNEVSTDGAVGIDDAQTTVNITDSTISALQISSAPITAEAGQMAGPIRVELKNSIDQTVPAVSDVIVTLGGGSGFVNSQGQSISDLTISTGEDHADFYYKTNSPETTTMTVSANALTGDSQVITYAWGNATQIDLTSFVSSGIAGQEAGPYVVTLKNSSGIAVPAQSSVTVNLVSSSADGRFDTVSGGDFNGSITSIDIEEGQSNASFYYKDTLSGSATLSTNANGLTGDSGVISIAAGNAAGLQILSGVQTIVRDTNSQAIQVRVVDEFGNEKNVDSNTSISLQSNSSDYEFSQNTNPWVNLASVNVLSGNSTVSFFYKDHVLGQHLMSFVASFSTVTQEINILDTPVVNNPPVKILFQNSPQTLIINNASTFNFYLADASNNYVAAQDSTTATLSSDSGTGRFYDQNSSLWVSSITVDFAQGDVLKAFQYKDSAAGTATITIFANGLASASQQVNVENGVVAKVTMSMTTSLKTSDRVPVTISLKTSDDLSANTLTDVTLALATSDGGKFFNGGGAEITSINISAGNSSATVYYQKTTPGSDNLTIDENPSRSWTSAQAQVAVIAEGTNLTFITTPQSHIAGDITSVMSVELQDAYGNAVTSNGDTDIYLASDSGFAEFSQNSGNWSAINHLVIANGTSSTSFYYKDTAAGSHTITVSDAPGENPDAGIVNASQTVTTIAAEAVRIVPVAGEDQNLLAGQPSSIVTVQLRDQYGNAKTVSQQTRLYLSSTSATGVFSENTNFSAQNLITSTLVNAGSSSVSFYYQNLIEGTDTITVSSNDPNISQAGIWDFFSAAFAAQSDLISATITINVSMGSPAKLLWESLPSNQTAGDVSIPIVVKITNDYDVEIPADSNMDIFFSSSSNAGQFSLDGSNWNANLSSQIQTGQSRKTVYYKDTNVASPLITASDVSSPTEDPDTGLINATGYISIIYGSIAKLQFSTAPQTIIANHESSIMTVTALNAFDVPVPSPSDTMLYLRTSSSRGSFSTDGNNWGINGVLLRTGFSQASFYYRDPLSASPVITVSEQLPVIPDSGWINATQTETITPQVVDSLRVTNISDPQYQGSPSSVVVIALDSDNYVVEEYAGTLTSVKAYDNLNNEEVAILPDMPYTFIPSIDRGMKTFTNAVAFLNTGEKKVTVTDSEGVTGSQENITVVAASTNAISQVKFVAPGEPLFVVSDAISQLITLQLQDSGGDPVNASGSGFEIKLTSSSSSAKFSVDGINWSNDTKTLSVPVGLSYASFYYKDAKADDIVLTAADWNAGIDDAGIENDTFSITVDPDTASYLKITGNITQIAGASQTINIIAYDNYGNVDTNYSGTKNITLTGASTSVSGDVPTCTDRSGDSINFGTNSEIEFAQGVANCSMVLYQAESAEIELTDGVIGTTGSQNYDLDVTVQASNVNAGASILNAAPNPQKTEAPVTISVQPKDIFGNIVDDANLNIIFTVTGANEVASAQLLYDSVSRDYLGSYLPKYGKADVVKAYIGGQIVGKDLEGTSDGLFHITIEGDIEAVECNYIKLKTTNSASVVLNVCISQDGKVSSAKISKNDDGNTGLERVVINAGSNIDINGELTARSHTTVSGMSAQNKYQPSEYAFYKRIDVSSDFSFNDIKDNTLEFRIPKSWINTNNISGFVASHVRNDYEEELIGTYKDSNADFDIYAFESEKLEGEWAIYGIVAQNEITTTDITILTPVADITEEGLVVNSEDVNKNISSESGMNAGGIIASLFGVSEDNAKKIVEFTANASTAAAAAAALPMLPNVLGMLRLFSSVPLRKRKQWGMVYDTDNGKPIPYALVSILDEAGRVKEVKNSDSNGVYYFMARPGIYTVEATKEGYIAMDKIDSQSFRTYYDKSFDKGDKIQLEKEDVVSVNIPMQKVDRSSVSNVASQSVIMHSIFWVGFAASLIAFILNSGIYNILVLAFFAANYFYMTFVIKTLKGATLIDKNDAFLPFAAVRILDENGDMILRTSTNEKGRFVAILDAGVYAIEASNGVKISKANVILKRRRELINKIKLV